MEQPGDQILHLAAGTRMPGPAPDARAWPDSKHPQTPEWKREKSTDRSIRIQHGSCKLDLSVHEKMRLLGRPGRLPGAGGGGGGGRGAG